MGHELKARIWKSRAQPGMWIYRPYGYRAGGLYRVQVFKSWRDAIAYHNLYSGRPV